MAQMTTANAANTVKAAYDRAIYGALRPLLYMAQIATVKPTKQSQPGNTVVFTKNADMTIASTPLDESTDVSLASLSNSQVTVTLKEYGNAAGVTEKLLGVSFDIPAYDEGAAERVGFNAGESIDAVAHDELVGGSNVAWATGGSTTPTSAATVESDDLLTAHDVRVEHTRLSNANVMPWRNGLFKSLIHGSVAIDLREETGSGGWRVPAEYTPSDMEIAVGSIGAFEGFEFCQTPTLRPVDDGGSGTIELYRTLFLGQQALAKAFSKSVSGEFPQARIRPPVDVLLRFHTLGWYWLGGFKRFREESIRRVESASSLGDNT